MFANTSTISTNWREIVESYDFTLINLFLNKEEEKFKDWLEIYPPKDMIFNCFNHFDIENTKVVVIGQDPYIRKNQAMGLSFSVPKNMKVPPSLKNIIKEINISLSLNNDLNTGDLTNWAKQGVLLLNRSLTVREGKSNSHKKIWLPFTEMIVKYISNNLENIVFLLWGRNAEEVKTYIDSDKHLILISGHPSPLNRKKDFIGNKHFIKTNTYLKLNNKSEIDWKI
tara:strand:+ start:112 stop:789 length:678 start_codon:yes stop_codon:yes gene_type:complete